MSTFGQALMRETQRAMHAARAERLHERRSWMTLYGGPPPHRSAGRSPDAAQSRWARLSAEANKMGFGHPGGVACGCHTPSCVSCMRTGGCGWLGCGPCGAYGYLMSMLPKKTGSIDWSELRLPGSITPGVEPSETPIQTIFDFHAHGFGTTLADMVDYAVGSASTMGTQMDRVVSLQTGVPRVKQSVLAVMKNPRAGEGYSSDSFVLNFATALAAYKNPDAFIGFAQVLPEEMRNPGLDVADEAELWLSGMAFGGIGELFVHGHHENYNADVTLPGDNLSELCEIARTYNVPILVHWEFGRTDEEEDPAEERTPEENFQQLLALLNRFMAPDPPRDLGETDEDLKFRLKLVVAHCGLGPADSDADAALGGIKSDEMSAWLERMDALLIGYQNVLFDLAGLQVGDATVDPTVAVQRLFVQSTGSPTAVGSALLERIQKYPTRFLLGTDANGEYESTTGSALGIDSYKASIQQYLDFLDMGSLSYDDKRAVCEDNATQVLYGVYP